MARKPRVHFPGALYHVIARGNQRQSVFLDRADFQTYLAYLSEYQGKFSFHLYAYALMENHLHLLLRVEEVPLAKVMQVLQFRYTQYFNRRYGKEGHLFQGRYKAILCDQELYLLELVRYIHLNPVRAGMVKTPEAYPWTGHLAYLGGDREIRIEKDSVLRRFGNRKAAARRRYEEFVLEGLRWGHQGEFYRVKDQRYLGEDGFVEEVEKRKEDREAGYLDVSLEEISTKVSEAIGVPFALIHSLTRERRGAFCRGLVGYLGRKLGGLPLKEIARYFQREPMALSLGIRKVEDLLRRDQEMAQRLEMLEKELRKGRRKKYFITIA
jgi:putative transposase